MNITVRPWKKDSSRFEADVMLGKFRRRYVIPLKIHQHLTKQADIDKACSKYAEKKALGAFSNKEEIIKKKSNPLTVDQFYPQFETDLANNSPATQDSYSRLYHKHLKPLTKDWVLNEITTQKIDNLRSTLLSVACSKTGLKTKKDKKFKHVEKGIKADKPLSGRTVNSILTCFNSMLTRAHRWQLIAHKPHFSYVPVVHSEGSKIDKEKYYDIPQEVALIKAAYALGIQPTVFILLGLDAGLRVGEMAALQWDNIDFTRKTITVKWTVVVKGGEQFLKAPKKNKVRTVSMATDRLYMALKTSYDSSDKKGRVLQKVLLSEAVTRGLWGGSDISPGGLKYWMRVITTEAQKLEPRVKPCNNPHRLRHTCATRIADKTQNPMAVQSQLGHASINTTMIYMHNEYHDEIASAMKDAFNPFNNNLKLVKNEIPDSNNSNAIGM